MCVYLFSKGHGARGRGSELASVEHLLCDPSNLYVISTHPHNAIKQCSQFTAEKK